MITAIGPVRHSHDWRFLYRPYYLVVLVAPGVDSTPIGTVEEWGQPHYPTRAAARAGLERAARLSGLRWHLERQVGGHWTTWRAYLHREDAEAECENMNASQPPGAGSLWWRVRETPEAPAMSIL